MIMFFLGYIQINAVIGCWQWCHVTYNPCQRATSDGSWQLRVATLSSGSSLWLHCIAIGNRQTCLLTQHQDCWPSIYKKWCKYMYDQKFITGLVYWAGPTYHQTGSCGRSKQKGTLIPQLAAPQENGLSMPEKMLQCLYKNYKVQA